jgi:hypothetical protein
MVKENASNKIEADDAMKTFLTQFIDLMGFDLHKVSSCSHVTTVSLEKLIQLIFRIKDNLHALEFILRYKMLINIIHVLFKI